MIRNLTLLGLILFAMTLLVPARGVPERAKGDPAGWTEAAPRDEIRPAFAFDARGGLDGKGCWTIRADRREGQHGWWTKTVPVEGGKHYRFTAAYQAPGVETPRRSVHARVLWTDDKGKKVVQDRANARTY